MIQTEQLSIRYGSTVAVRNATLSIPQGHITTIVGPSGCGKSSFLAALNRMTDLIPGTQVDGRILFDHEDIHHAQVSPASLRRRIGMIFQKPNPFPQSIRKNIQLALKEHGTRNQQILNQLTRQVLREVGLWEEVKDRLDQSALQLSGGQQQRLCLARAIALEPEVLLMDEPCSALDPISTERIEALIRTLRGKFTILLVTHNLAQARRLADHVAVFWLRDGAGEIIEQGTAKEVFENCSHPTAKAYLAGTQG